MIGRRYRAPIAVTTAFTTAIDVFELLAGATTPLALTGFTLGQPTELGDGQEEQLPLVLRYVTGAPTSGTGGGVSTPRPVLPGDVASAATLNTGNTTVLVGGTAVELARIPWNVRTDAQVIWIPEMWQVCAAGARLTLSLVGAPTDSVGGVHGSVEFAELV